MQDGHNLFSYDMTDEKGSADCCCLYDLKLREMFTLSGKYKAKGS